METLAKELQKLESKSSGASLTASIESVEQSIRALERWRASILAEDDGMDGDDDHDTVVSMEERQAGNEALERIRAAGSKVAEGNKEWYGAMSKYSKAVDKKFAIDITPLLPVPAGGALASGSSAQDDDSHMFFSSKDSKTAIDNAIAMHFVRSGREHLADVFIRESGITFPRERLTQFSALHRVTNAIRLGDLAPAFEWVAANRSFLNREGRHYSPLEFHLHRSQYVRLLLSDTYPLPPSLASSPYGDEVSRSSNMSNGVSSSSSSAAAAANTARTSSVRGSHRAFAYARAHFGPFYSKHSQEISSLAASALYLPVQRLLSSPYGGLFTLDGQKMPYPLSTPPPSDPAEDIYHAPYLVNLFASEYCRSLNMSKDLPLKVVTDIGGGGALAKIAKVRGVMKEKRTEWTTVQELPVEIPLPNAYRYHSVFACPVSKEQATEANPPMMMPCGHVVAEQSLRRLCKGGQNVRCPYCPLSSAVNQAIRVYF